MRSIKHVLTERQYAWEDAVELAQQDPEINMSGEGPVFTPSSYLDAPEESPEEEAKNAALRRLAADAMAAKEAAAAARVQEGQKEAPRI
jgi:large subunit ribosomal protein L47